MNFQEIVIYVALVIMIIALIVVFMMLYYSSDKNQFPPIIGSCPDFWVINDRGECANHANIAGPRDDFAPVMGASTAKEQCELKTSMISKQQTWDGITNNDKICDFA